MLNEQVADNFFNHINELWIQPEILRRFGISNIPADFHIREAMIKLPSGSTPIIEFNDEIGWRVDYRTPSDVKIETGEPVYLHQIEHIGPAHPPMVNGDRVAFVYIYWAGYSHNILFDFDPDSDDFGLGEAIADHVRAKLYERVVRLAQDSKNSDLLGKIGLWTASPLLPYPLSRIIERLNADKYDEARQILIRYCTPEFIGRSLVDTWLPIVAFGDRRKVFDQALSSHAQGHFIATIYTLIAQIEGVIVEWLYHVLPQSDVKWKTKSRMQQFRDVVDRTPELGYANQNVLESTIRFLQEEGSGGPFQAFKDWLQDIDENFPARHAISHGKYQESIFTEENSIKLFLLLDTLCQLMMFYEVRVLGRDLKPPT